VCVCVCVCVCSCVCHVTCTEGESHVAYGKAPRRVTETRGTRAAFSRRGAWYARKTSIHFLLCSW